MIEVPSASVYFLSLKMEDNLSAVFYGINDVRLEQRPIPEPGPDEVLVRMNAVGLCGTELHMLSTGHCGPVKVEKPIVLGHESAGTVAKCGQNVKKFKPGDRVAIEPAVPCRVCDRCMKGRYNLCPHVYALAFPPHHGSLCRFYPHHADFCHKLPDNVSMEEGGLLEPLSVAVHVCRRAGVAVGNKVLVSGSGPIGVLVMMVAKAMGADSVTVVDICDERLRNAKSFGADHTFNASSKDPEQLANGIIESLGYEPDITMECSGVESSSRFAMFVTKPGGVMVQVGHGKRDVNVPLITAAMKELTIIGSMRYLNCYPIALELVRSRRVNLKSLITHRFPLERILEALHVAKTDKTVIKVVVTVGEE